jgi:hypothetical protein
MPVIGGIAAGISAIGGVVQTVNSADAAGKAQGLMDQQNKQQQDTISQAQQHQSDFMKQQAAIGQRDAGLREMASMGAWRSNFAGTQLTPIGGIIPQAGQSMTKIGG